MTRPFPGQLDLSCPSPAVFGGPGAGSPAALEELRPERGARRLGTDAWPAARLHSARLPGPAPARTRGPPARPVPSSAVLQRAVRRRRVLQNKRLPYPSRAVAKARASLSRASAATMATSSARPAFLVMTALALLLLLCVGPGSISGNKLKLMLRKREAPAPTTTPVAVQESRAKEFLSSLRRPKRQLWDRSRPEVQQWYQHFLYLGFDEAKFEDDISYWLNRNRNGHDYYDYYQRHYDEDAAIGPRSAHSFRHGASVNYDDY
ncbi:augurin [Muntiacus reevesi]|uniref:augurin n=1 Tax=Muntiacus reevesi TaxID=9886 RepID=UPI0033073E9D